MAESNFCRRQILMYKDGPRTKRIKIFFNGCRPITYRYSYEAEKQVLGFYDNFKLKKPFGLHSLYKNIFTAL